MSVIDAHCDVLCKLLQHPQADFFDENTVTATLPRLIEGKVLLQFFAIYIPEQLTSLSYAQILKAVDLYYSKIVSHPSIIPVYTKSDLYRITSNNQIGALLALEGVDALPPDPLYIRLLYRLGLRSIGLTWNHANWAADGIAEPRNGGLTQKGIQLVKECEKLGILLDVSHLSVKSFWDVAQCAASGVFASHSNVKDICKHPRNLAADQVDYLIHTSGMIGLTFVPAFVHDSGNATIHDLLMHIEYICERGGAHCIGLGSDFDGIDRTVAGLEHPGKYDSFRNELSQHYRESDIENWMYKNWFTFLNNHLSD